MSEQPTNREIMDKLLSIEEKINRYIFPEQELDAQEWARYMLKNNCSNGAARRANGGRK